MIGFHAVVNGKPCLVFTSSTVLDDDNLFCTTWQFAGHIDVVTRVPACLMPEDRIAVELQQLATGGIIVELKERL